MSDESWVLGDGRDKQAEGGKEHKQAVTRKLMRRQPWLQFRLATLLFAILLAALVLAFFTPEARRARLVQRHRDGKVLLERSFSDTSGRRLRVLVVGTEGQPWPISLPLTIVVADRNYHGLVERTVEASPLVARSYPGSPAFHSGSLELRDGTAVLALTCLHRDTSYGTYRYKLSADGIEPFGDVEWDPRIAAEMDWQNKAAWIAGRSVEFTDRLTITHEYDEETGLPLLGDLGEEYCRAYSKRIGELIEEFGLPSWSAKREFEVYRIPNADYAKVLKSDELEQFSATPYRLNSNIMLVNGPFDDPEWGSSSGGFAVLSKSSRSALRGEEAEKIYAGRLKSYPSVIFVRADNTWAAAYTSDGTLIGTVSQQ